MSTRRPKWLGLAFALFLTLPTYEVAAGTNDVLSVNTLNPQRIMDTLKLVGDWQLDHPTDFDPRNWAIAPLYNGLIDASLATGDPKYLAAVVRAGRRIDFEPGSRTYHADGHAAGRAWLRLYLMSDPKDPKLLEPFKERFDEIVSHPITENISFVTPLPPGIRRTDRWTWSDALFMSPPTIVVLAQATGDQRYLDFMDSEYRFAYNALYDPQENLFYRDARYFDDRAPNGQKLFWSRGNGWVYAGLALVLESLPADRPTQQFYVTLFTQMSQTLRGLQQPDGFWYPSLKDPQQVPSPEASGTALFTLGMAWGVGAGLLDAATYWPVVERAWRAILTAVDSDGAVNFAQPIGDVPEPFDPRSRVAFGTGAGLSAGAYILRTLGAAAQVDPATLLDEADALVDDVPDLSSVCDGDCETPSGN